MLGYQIILGILGLLFGTGVAAGVFALVASLGMVPRMAGKTSVAAYVPALENALIFGGIFGCILAIFPQLPFQVGTWFLLFYGLASGVFLGCLSVALAEVLNVFPVLFRRASLKNGLGFLITTFAAGKTVGSLIYFFWVA
ncbi:stage V sporulation protein AB [uncultured Eubacterium sp.]|uniref:stage V sporulation protein AB n=1 Tax=uncultured Eubacterium sp. TaxID=165185 RepID=UPI0025D4F142|nr:stage V sporulation protein AB [uncultured Eubacterium sp.]